MNEIDDLMQWGSVTISSDKKNNLIGYGLIRIEDGYVPWEMTKDDLKIFQFYKNIFTQLLDGYTLYICNGKAYLGYRILGGPYGEDNKFVSCLEAEALTFIDLIQKIDYKIKNNMVKNKELIRNGEFYQERRC